MEKQAKNRKSTWLSRKLLHLPIGWQIAIVLLVAIGAYVLVRCLFALGEAIYDEVTEEKYYVSRELGDDYEVHTYYWDRDRITRKGERRAVVKDIDWVVGNDGDSLWAVAKNRRRAYFNSQTGEMMTPFIYRKAWVYSEGAAAVVDTNNRLWFIDPQGNHLFDHSFAYDGELDYDFLFHNGICQIVDTTGKVGIVDMKGEWIVAPQYDTAVYTGDYWWLTQGDSLTVLDSTGHTLIALTSGQRINIMTDGNIEVWHQLHPGRLYDPSGKLVARQTYWNLERLKYYDSSDEIGVSVDTEVLKYGTEYAQYGLLSLDGKVLTEAVYSEIEAIGKNLFRAEYTTYESSYQSFYVLLNDKGELLEKTER